MAGTPVMISTGVTGSPSCCRAAAVPPLAMRSQPSSARVRAKGRRPVLSETLRRARGMGKILLAG